MLSRLKRIWNRIPKRFKKGFLIHAFRVLGGFLTILEGVVCILSLGYVVFPLHEIAIALAYEILWSLRLVSYSEYNFYSTPPQYRPIIHE